MNHPATLLLVLALATSASASVQTKTIEYKVGELTLEGLLAWDDAQATPQSKQPGVLVCHEWWGNADYPRERAKQLAELGYVAFALDVYGKGKTTSDPKVASGWLNELFASPATIRERASAGLAQLVAAPQVDATRVGAIGYCMGGTIALELARTGANLRSVVAFHTSKLTSLGDAADDAKIRAVVTVCHGDADAFVEPTEHAKFREQMVAAKVDYQILAYAGAVHAFTNPKAGTYKVPGVEYHARADARSWSHMQSALTEAFARQ